LNGEWAELVIALLGEMKKWPRVVDTCGHAEERSGVMSQNPSYERPTGTAA